MTPEQIQQILDSIANVGGMLAQVGFELAVRQARAEAASYALWGVACLILSAALWRATKWAWRETEEAGLDFGFVVFLGTVFFAAVVCSVICLNKTVLYFVNPEWRAIELLMGLATGG